MIYFSPYKLRGAFQREGALIRIGNGFADLHPWPELGDEPLDYQLKHFGHTRLTRQAAIHAFLDASARERGVNLLEGLAIPESHFLVTDDAIPSGWSHYKVKLEHIRYLDQIPGKVRIDCNGKLSLEEAKELFSKLDPEKIDFVEDPTTDSWEELLSFGIPLAEDFISSAHASIKVFKPARERRPFTDRPLVTTCTLGHPLGQAIAAYYAAKSGSATSGLLSHHAYELNAYSEKLSQKGPAFTIPPGTGFGFDELLNQESWHAIKLDI